MYGILIACICVQVSIGQYAYFNPDYPYLGASDLNSGLVGPSDLQQSSSSELLNKEQEVQICKEPNTPIIQTQFPTESCLASLLPPVENPLPVQIFFTELNSQVCSSQTLPSLYDLSDVSVEDISKYFGDFTYELSVSLSYSDPTYITNMVADPIMKGRDTYPFPIVLDIYANTIAKYLFAEGILSSYNAPCLARKYVKMVEESAKRNWIRDVPKSKLVSLIQGYCDFMKSINQFSMGDIVVQVIFFAKALKSVADKL